MRSGFSETEKPTKLKANHPCQQKVIEHRLNMEILDAECHVPFLTPSRCSLRHERLDAAGLFALRNVLALVQFETRRSPSGIESPRFCVLAAFQLREFCLCSVLFRDGCDCTEGSPTSTRNFLGGERDSHRAEQVRASNKYLQAIWPEHD